MLRFISLSSGSCGNCYYLGTEEEGVIIDAGISLRRLKKIFAENSIDIDTVKAVLVTHDHLDHIRFLGSFCKYLSKPVYTTREIHSALAVHTFTASTITPCRHILEAGKDNTVGGMSVRYFEVPHDATQTVGFSIGIAGHRLVIMTDIGRMTDEAVEIARSADTVVIESNYDIDMLMRGPYTKELKMRIIQGNGHLSNDECASALKRIFHPGLRNVFLCHLSHNNNTPSAALECATDALSETAPETDLSHLECLPRSVPSEMFIL